MSGEDQADRLARDLRTMQALAEQSDIFEFKAEGDPPKTYDITLHGKGISRGSLFGEEIELADVHEFRIRLGRAYPREEPEIRWRTPVFHPNLPTLGNVRLAECGLEWTEETTLDEVCERMWDAIRGAFMKLENGSNYSAREWFEKRPDFALPVDARPLRGTSRKARSRSAADKSDEVELLKALVVLAAADGVIHRRERALLDRLAKRVGVSATSLDAAIEKAMQDPTRHKHLFRKVVSRPVPAMELLVAAAQIDGRIDEAEKQVLASCMKKLEIPHEQLSEICKRGIARAKALRKKG
jgi:ubiquitin-protein ligase/tellurite resistance protein